MVNKLFRNYSRHVCQSNMGLVWSTFPKPIQYPFLGSHDIREPIVSQLTLIRFEPVNRYQTAMISYWNFSWFSKPTWAFVNFFFLCKHITVLLMFRRHKFVRHTFAIRLLIILNDSSVRMINLRVISRTIIPSRVRAPNIFASTVCYREK